MAEIRKIGTVTFTKEREPELMAKLNVVAPHTRRKVHDLVRFLLNEALDKLIEKYGIKIDYPQPARKTG